MNLTKILLIILLPSLSLAGPIEDSKEVHKLLSKLYLDGKKQESGKLGFKIAKALPQNSPFQSVVRDAIDASSTSEQIDSEKKKEIYFATGEKSEIYCRGVGLVHMEGRHNNGTASKLILIKNNRGTKKDQYAIMGDSAEWSYELENAYRPASISELYQPYGRQNAFDIIEIRKKKSGHADKGYWSYQWGDKNSRSNHSINGSPKEPTRMYMALQYHIWGSPELGYTLKFEQGYEDQKTGFTSASTSGRINLKSKRKVTEHLPSFSYKDSKGKEYSYNDCWQVESSIEFESFGKK